MEDTHAITVTNLSFGYGDSLLLDQVSFAVRDGDFAAVIGSNGTGKSTMIKLLLGLLTPISGEIRILGKAVGQIRDFSRIGYVPQNSGHDASSFPATVEEIVLSGLYREIGFLRPVRKKHKLRVAEALASVGMQDHASDLMGKLSGGQQQRVMLARVLVNRPQILLLDEPTVGIDAAAVKSLLTILHRLNIENKVTIVMVTHDLDVCAPYLSRVFCLTGHNFAENRIPESVIIHAHPPIETEELPHIHCAACEGGPHNSDECAACVAAHTENGGPDHV